MKNIHKSYTTGSNTMHVLKGIDLTIGEGEFVSIMGSSGSGKSTLLNILGILDDYDEGEYWLNGTLIKDLTETKAAFYRNKFLGFVFQSFNLLPRLNVKQNVLLPHYYRKSRDPGARERADKALATVGMEDRTHHRPTQLSGGQRQRVAIARALTNDPSLILADEPTGNLDSITAASILDLFTELNRQGRTVIIVTHDAHVAGRTKRQVHVADGKILRDQSA